MKETAATFGARLQRIVDERGLTQARLAELAKASAGAVNSWLKDGILPRGENLLQLCERLKVSADWLLTGRGSPYLDAEVGDTEAEPAPPAGATDMDRQRFWQMLEEIRVQYSDTRERGLAWDSIAANLRALASYEAERAREQAERAREEEARAARFRAKAAIEDAKSRKVAERRALVRSRPTPTSDDGGPPNDRPDPRPPPQEGAG